MSLLVLDLAGVKLNFLSIFGTDDFYTSGRVYLSVSLADGLNYLVVVASG